MTLKEFRKYILRKLGSPVINVEIDDSQLNDAIDDAVQLFYESHYDGVNVGYIFLDVTADTQNYTLDSTVHDVIKILGSDSYNYADDPLLIKESFQYGFYFDNDLISTEIWRQNIQNTRNYYNREILFDFNSVSKNLHLLVNPEVDVSYALRVYQSELDLEDIYGDRWLKQYAVALAKKQWGGLNIGKYSGAALPGGAQFNYSDILAQAEGEIEKLEEQLEDRYSEPIDFEIA